MAVHFVIGRSGSGKTQRVRGAIVESLRADPLDGPPIYWILPRQATFSAERDLTCGSGLPGFCRARVVSFEKLSEDILADCGGLAVPQVTPLGRQMILGHLLRRHETQLKYFASVARLGGLAARLDATFGEFERCGKTTEDLDALLAALSRLAPGHENATLRDKVHDLALIYRAYGAYLGQERIDQHRRLLQVLDCIARCCLFNQSTVYIDGFREFSAYERQVIAQLGKVCRHVEVTLTMDPASPVIAEPDLLPSEDGLFHPIETAYRRLRLLLRQQQVPVDDPPTLLIEPLRFQTPSLLAVERMCFGRVTVESQRQAQHVELVECPDARCEADAAARKVRQLLTAGLRLRDVAVLVRDLEAYHDALAASFREHEVPFFVDRARPVAHHPLLRVVRALLHLAADGNWSHEPIMTLLKSGLAGLGDDEADELENYVLRHRVTGRQWEVDEAWALGDEALPSERQIDEGPQETADNEVAAPPQRARALRDRLIEPLRPLVRGLRDKRLAVRHVAAQLFAALERLGVRATLVRWMDDAATRNEHEHRAEHEQVWTELTQVFDEMVELLGDEEVTLNEFIEVLEAGLQQFGLRLTPPTVDEVLVGQVDRTRPPGGLKAVLVLGLNEGEFPRPPSEDSVLSDAERRELRDRDVDVEPPTDRRMLDEAMLGYVAFTAASRHLYVSRAIAAANGRVLGASAFWIRLCRLFPLLQPRQVSRDGSADPEQVSTPRQLVTALMRWARGPAVTNSLSPCTPPADGETRNPNDQSMTNCPMTNGGHGHSSLQRTHPAWPALYQWFCTYEGHGDAIERARRLAWRALAYHNDAWLARDTTAAMFASPLRASIAQLESFAACPFQHFLRYGLLLDPRPADDVSALDLSGVYHHVLQELVRGMLSGGKTWADVTAAEQAALIDAAADQIAATLRGQILLSSARNEYLLKRIKSTLRRVVAQQAAAAARGAVRPVQAAVAFGPGGRLPAYEVGTPRGRVVQLRGRIDRVDIAEDRASLIDYRLGANALDVARVYHGLSLQLLTHLLVLDSAGQRLIGRPLTPVAAFYVKMLRALQRVAHPDDATPPHSPKWDLDEKQRGIFDGRYLSDFDASIEEGWSDVVSAYVKKEGGYGHRGKGDAAEPTELAALMALVKAQLGQLADGILDGQIDVAPYLFRQNSPCAHCEYSAVCRFDTTRNRYRVLPVLSRAEVLDALLGSDSPEGGDDDDR